jgi:uncharacterized protein YdhG (YjbR/CyaY superfamily)
VHFSGFDPWTIIQAFEKKTNSFELKCYRKILRIQWTAKVKNTDITDILTLLRVKESWLINNILAREKESLNTMAASNGTTI